MLRYEMSNVFNGNGNGTSGLLHPTKRRVAPPAATATDSAQDSQVIFKTVEGTELRGVLSRLTRHVVVFELYNPGITPQFSEVFNELKIITQKQTVYSGRAVVCNVVDAGTRVVCEATLSEEYWTDVDRDLLSQGEERVRKEFKNFLHEWQKLYKVTPEFKVVIADMQTFLHDLRLWLEQVELGLRDYPLPLRAQIEKETIDNLAGPIIQSIDSFIDQFETLVMDFEEDMHFPHYAYLRRQLHPYIMSSPFAHRAFTKPLGYAGDYQMVDMMIRPPYEGKGLFAKIINIWLLEQTPAQAHRNRVDHLERRLFEETLRAKAEGRDIRVFNIGCGPAAEVQRFFGEQVISHHADMTLLDFNEETLAFLRKKPENIQRTVSNPMNYKLIKKSVHQILKDSNKSSQHKLGEKYHYIYCAGLFDYLSDSVCKQLLNIFYDMLTPGGLLLATNATDVLNVSRPFRFSMEYLLDWHLIYRDKNQFAAVAPDLADADDVMVSAEDTGANLFLEVRKPKNV